MRTLSVCCLESLPALVQFLTMLCCAEGKEYIETVAEKKKKKAYTDSKGLNGGLVFYFPLELFVWGGPRNVWL